MKDSNRLFISSAVGAFIYLTSQTTTASSYLTHARDNQSRDNAPLPYPNKNQPAQPKQPAVISRREVAIRKEEQDTSLITPPDFYLNGSGNLNLQDACNGRQKYLNLQNKMVGERGYSRKRL